jgi:MarR family
MADWGFLTNHARALLCIAHDPGVRLRDLADTLNITERSAFAIVSDLTDAGYVLKERDGRRNRYVVQHHLPLPETTIRERTVGEVLALLLGETPRRRRTASAQKKTRPLHRTKGAER